MALDLSLSVDEGGGGGRSLFPYETNRRLLDLNNNNPIHGSLKDENNNRRVTDPQSSTEENESKKTIGEENVHGPLEVEARITSSYGWNTHSVLSMF